MTQIALRTAAPADAETLLGIQRSASVAALADIFPPDRYPFPSDAVRGRWENALADAAAHVLVAEVAGRAVGAALVRGECLEALYVVPELWGAGVGPLLHDRAVELVRRSGARSAHLWVLEANQRARRFYERRGWRENGRTHVVPYPPNPVDVGYTLELG